ncbi:MAG: hypothetical protein ACOY5Y_06395 [Pseudomonadota bacterium]|jgi:hypothetical protein
MRNAPERSVLTVVRHEGVWCVEHDGRAFGHSPEKNVAKAAASRHARELFDAGTPCQVKVWGELGWGGRP